MQGQECRRHGRHRHSIVSVGSVWTRTTKGERGFLHRWLHKISGGVEGHLWDQPRIGKERETQTEEEIQTGKTSPGHFTMQAANIRSNCNTCFYLHPAHQPRRSRDRGGTCLTGESCPSLHGGTCLRGLVCAQSGTCGQPTPGERPRATHSTLAAVKLLVLKLLVLPHVFPASTSAPQNTWLLPRKASSRLCAVAFSPQ